MRANHHNDEPRGSNSRLLPIMLAILVVFTGCHLVRLQVEKINSSSKLRQPEDSYQRIIALSPSIVEIIYKLGLEACLVGVSRFAHYPPDAKTKPSVGGYLDLHIEKVLQLEPDCIILLREQEQIRARMHQLGICTITVDHSDTAGVLESIHTIGKKLGHGGKARDLVDSIQTQARKQSSAHSPTTPKPRVMVCIDRDTSAKHLQQVIIAGSAGYHRELVEMAGGKNAYEGSVPFPTLSREKLIALKPDVIIDLVNTETGSRVGKEHLLAPWYALGEMEAVANRRVTILHGDQHLIPGPRYPETLKQIAQAIYPSK